MYMCIYRVYMCIYVYLEIGWGAGCSSGGRALCYKGLDPLAWRINPAWQKHLQFRLLSVPTSGPQVIDQRLWNVLSCLWESAYKRSPYCISERVAYVATAGFL